MKNFLSKSLSIILLIGLPITLVECGNIDNSNVEINYVNYQESSVVKPIINIHSIANKTMNEVKNILGEPGSIENTKYGVKYIYLDGKVEILFFKDVASHISVESEDENIELLGFNKSSLKNLSSKNKFEYELTFAYKELEGIHYLSYARDTDLFVIITKEQYDFDYGKDENEFLQNIINETNKNNNNYTHDEIGFTANYYSKLNTIISKYNTNYSDNYYNELDDLLNEIYILIKNNTDKEIFSKIEKQEIEWINYKESKNNLQDKIYDTEMRIRDLLHIMENLQSYDVMNEYIPYFKNESNNLIESSANNSIKSEIIFTEIPNLLGLDVETAKNILDNSHLKYVIEEIITGTEIDDGKIITQSIEAKSQVAEWSTLTIRVGKYVKY